MRIRGGRAGAFGLAALAATTVLAGAGAGPAPAAALTCTTSWAEAADGHWDDASRWSAGVPGAQDVACLDGAGPYTVTLDVDATVASARVGAGATLRLVGDVQLAASASGGTIVHDGTIDLGADGSLGGMYLEQAGGARLEAIVDGTDGHADSGFWSMRRGATVHLTVPGPLAPSTTYHLIPCVCEEVEGLGWYTPASIEGDADLGIAFAKLAGLRVRTAATPARRAALGLYQALHPHGSESSTYGRDEARLAAGEVTPAQLARELIRTGPHRAMEVDRLYHEILDRHPDRTGRDRWVREIRLGRRTVATVAAAMMGSREYGGASPTTAHWVGRVFQDVLGRDPSDADRARFAAGADAVGRGTVAHRLLQSPEGRRRRAAVLFHRALLRQPGTAERAYWADRLLTQDDSTVLAVLLGTAEARASHQGRYRYS